MSNRITVSITAHTNSGIRSRCIPFDRIFIIVIIKLIAPKIDDAPARCGEKIAISTDGPLWAILLVVGGYTVQPVPTPYGYNEYKY